MASGKVGRRLPALRPAQHPPSESTCRWGSALGTWEVVEAAVFWARPACRGEKRGDPRATTETLGGPAVRRATVAAWAGGVARGEGAGSLSLAARLGFTTQVNQRPCA